MKNKTKDLNNAQKHEKIINFTQKINPILLAKT